MPKYQCPTCESIYDSPLDLSEAPICSKNGTHTPKPMKTINQEGTNSDMSTTQTMKARQKADKAADKAAATPKAPKAPKVSKTPDKPCQCYAIPVEGSPGQYVSCGRLTRNEFAPGHDAKLKSALILCAVLGIGYETEGGGQNPRVAAANRGWEKFIDRAVEVASAKQAKRDAKAAETQASRDAKASEKAARAEAAKAKAIQKAAAADEARAAKATAKAEAAEVKAEAAPAKPKAPVKAPAPAKAPRARQAPIKDEAPAETW